MEQQPTLNWFSEEKNYMRVQAQKALDAHKKRIGKVKGHFVTNDPPTWIELPYKTPKAEVRERIEKMKEIIRFNQFANIYK
jgi:hypothetical protein